ncbi:MAG TPA: DUF222 domain-containing protein [Acidimicrobiales bacterium]|nr:DUF222 domain-containing protein [Acidimicrobiales bacterium]
MTCSQSSTARVAGVAESLPFDESHQLVSDVGNAVAALQHLRLDEFCADERADALLALDQARSSLEAHFAREVREFSSIANLREVGVASMSGWLVAATGTTRRDAGRRATLANTLAELPLLDEAMCAGEVPVEAARVIARALTPRTRHLFDVFTQAAFVDAAKHVPLDQLVADVEHWLEVVDADGPEPDDPTTDTLHAGQVGDRVRLRGDLSSETGIPLLAALDEEMAKIRAAEPRDPDGSLPWRPEANRRAQALGDLVGRGAAAPDSTTRREPAFIVVDAGTSETPRFELAGGTFVPDRLAQRWATGAQRLRLVFADAITGELARFVDADGNTVAGLDLGRTIRFANRAQRRALAARDRGCAFPGCNRAHQYCDAHHITWWEHGGTTDLDNLVLLCRFHHLLLHSGLYRVDMVDHGSVFRATDPDLPGWTGPPMGADWHRHETCDQRRRPARR